MTFQLKEIVYFIHSGQARYAAYDGAACQIVGLEREYPCIDKDGNKGKFTGYSVIFEHDKTQQIVKGDFLERSKLERGDMDRLITWDYFVTNTGVDPRVGPKEAPNKGE